MSMSAIRSGVDQAILALQDSAVYYRVGTSGTFLALPGAILNTDPPVSVSYDEDEGGETQMHTGTLLCRLTSTVLSIGDQVRDHQNQVWAVLGIDRTLSCVNYRIRREILSDAAYDKNRGGRE
jgi:hypothetical protein